MLGGGVFPSGRTPAPARNSRKTASLKLLCRKQLARSSLQQPHADGVVTVARAQSGWKPKVMPRQWSCSKSGRSSAQRCGAKIQAPRTRTFGILCELGSGSEKGSTARKDSRSLEFLQVPHGKGKQEFMQLVQALATPRRLAGGSAFHHFDVIGVKEDGRAEPIETCFFLRLPFWPNKETAAWECGRRGSAAPEQPKTASFWGEKKN